MSGPYEILFDSNVNGAPEFAILTLALIVPATGVALNKLDFKKDMRVLQPRPSGMRLVSGMSVTPSIYVSIPT